MSFGKAVKVSQGFQNKFFTKPKKQVNRYSSRIVNIPPVNLNYGKKTVQKYRPPRYRPPQNKSSLYTLPKINPIPNKKMNFSITKVENCDGATLILKKN